MSISADQVKQLRQRTGAGMMECKKALQNADGDLDAAADNMRREGLAKADKKAGRVAAEGRIAATTNADSSVAVLLELNSETDFVGKNPDFTAFADRLAQVVLEHDPADVDALAAIEVDGQSIDEGRRALVAKLGENITIRRFTRLEAGGGVLAVYTHGARIGSAVALSMRDETLAKDLAMHVAAQGPEYRSADDVPADIREREKQNLVAQARESGKPDNIIEKMVEGRLRKFLEELTLLGQPFVKDPDQRVETLLADAGADVEGYVRLEVGEGIETETQDFAAEVKAQAEKSG